MSSSRFLQLLPLFMTLCAGLAMGQQEPSPLIGKVIHVYNPRPGDTLFVDMSGQGHMMTPVAGTNWLTFTVPSTIQNHINKFGVRNPYGQNSFWIARTGTASGGADAFTMDDFAGGDSLWIIIDPAGPTTGAPVILTEAPKVVNVFNPWQLSGPVMALQGGTTKRMLTVPEKCGWFWAFLLQPAEYTFHLAEVNGTDTYGAGGLGNNTPFNMTTEFASKGVPTLWLDTDFNSWVTADPNKSQPCGYQMAATVRDFSISHPDFDHDGLQGDQSVPGMVQETLGPDRKPVRTAKTHNLFSQFEDWFNTKPGTNAETCVDLPMTKSDDGMWLYDSFDQPSRGYWPIDNFTTYNGAPNPHNQQTKASCYVRPIDEQWITNQPPHNMNFCMESHATFVYQKGQKFEFRGDDDVWVYINNKLALDLGGIHTPKADTIDLDLLGLEAGKTYNWDFFYCERQPCGSSLRIKTSIYFKQQRTLEAVEDPPNSGIFVIKKYSGGTGACGSVSDVVTEVPVTNLIYELWNATGTEKKPLTEGSNHGGGIVITTPKVVVDTSKILDLPPGNYRVVAYELSSQNIRAEVPFTIRNRSWVQFVPKVNAPVIAGTLVPVVAANQIGDAAPTGEMSYTFRVAPPEGLRIFSDPAGTAPVATLSGSTGADGLDTLWVGVDSEITAPVEFVLNTTGSSREVKVAFNPVPLDLPLVTRATVHDDDEDGIADRIVAVYDRDITALLPRQVAYRWPPTAAPVAVPGTGLGALTAGGTTVTLGGNPIGTEVRTEGTGSFLSTYQARGKDSVQTVPLTDGIAPVLLKAEMVGDTLRLAFSEPISTGAISAASAELFVYRLNQDGEDLRFPPSSVQWNPAGNQVDLIFPAGASDAPRSGNLVRIAEVAGGVADGLGNRAGPKSRLRLITGTKRAEINTVTFMKVDPAKLAGNPAPIVASLEPSNAKVEEVVDRTGRLGHLIKVDLGDHAQADDFTPVDPSKVFLEYQVGYFSNLGVPVATEKRTLSCLDPLYKGDCRTNRGYVFVGWNFNTLKNQRVATGAYVARIYYKVTVAGKSPVTGELDQVWGVLRSH